MIDWIRGIFLSKYAKSLARGLARAAAGALMAIGTIAPEEIEVFSSAAEPIIAGLLIFLVTQLLSFLDKKKNQPAPAKPQILQAVKADQ